MSGHVHLRGDPVALGVADLLDAQLLLCLATALGLLREELGVAPSPAVQRVHQRLLHHDSLT